MNHSPQKMEMIMTDIQVESGQPKRAKLPTEPTTIAYDDKAIAKGKKLAAIFKAAEWEPGKLADQLEPKYGDKTLARFAKDIGLDAVQLSRCHSTYRAWKGKKIKEPAPKFAVLQALQAHPKRERIINNRPNLTRAEARTLASNYRQAQAQDPDWRVNETRRFYSAAVKHAQEAIKYGFPAVVDMNPDVLRQAIDNIDQATAALRLGGNALLTLADAVEQALAPPPALPAPMFNDPPSPPAKDTPPDQAT